MPNFVFPDFLSQPKTHRTIWTSSSTRFLSFGQILTGKLPCQQSTWKGEVLFPVVTIKMLSNFWETLLESLAGQKAPIRPYKKPACLCYAPEVNEAQAQGLRQPKQLTLGIASCSTAATAASQTVAAASGSP